MVRVANRAYFYYVNHYGNLYVLEDEFQRKMPFGPSFLKDKKFLDFFFKRLQKNDDFNLKTHPDFPFVSKCGRELNFVKCAETPIVFQNLEKQCLIYGGSLKTQFDPSALLIKDGKLYHYLDSLQSHCLVETKLASELFEHFDFEEQNFVWQNEKFPIKHD
jgi:hypothetical protein